MNKELQKFLKFATVGVSNVIIDFGVFNLLLLVHLNAYPASIISYVLAMTNSFYFNRRWTFQDGQRDMWAQYLQFMAANAIGFLFNLGLVYLFTKYIDLGSYTLTTNAAKLLAVGLIVIWNYGVSRYVIFKPNKPEAKLH
jgi:putative flippase GtrA